jgi:putative membrane protein
MKKWFISFSPALLVILLASCSKDTDTPKRLDPEDIRFMYLAGQSNTAAINLGQLAADSSTTPAIKAFGQMMVTQHTTAQSDLHALGTRLGIPVPDIMDTAHDHLRTKLLALKGSSFDSLYIYGQVNDHINEVVLYEDSHDIGNNTEVKQYILVALPPVQQHLVEAQNIAQGY